jgi:hypothetical protein
MLTYNHTDILFLDMSPICHHLDVSILDRPSVLVVFDHIMDAVARMIPWLHLREYCSILIVQ